jgi:hypothetical protein
MSVRLFIEAWSELPSEARNKVLEHRTKEENPSVLLELSNAWKNCAIRDAEARLAGCEVKFNAAEVDRMPDEVVKALIAHGLAHVYQYATGGHRRTYDELEVHAEDLICQWGFAWVARGEWKAKRRLGML